MSRACREPAIWFVFASVFQFIFKIYLSPFNDIEWWGCSGTEWIVCIVFKLDYFKKRQHLIHHIFRRTAAACEVATWTWTLIEWWISSLNLYILKRNLRKRRRRKSFGDAEINTIAAVSLDLIKKNKRFGGDAQCEEQQRVPDWRTYSHLSF